MLASHGPHETSRAVAIIDYGIGNLGSLANAIKRLGYRPDLITDPKRLGDYEHAILPGVGHFGACVTRLRSAGFEEPILERIRADRWLLGICVGMQLLFEGSEESDQSGLGVLAGRVSRMRPGQRLPEMQWNRLHVAGDAHPAFALIEDGTWSYFVHSYAAMESADAIAWEDYGGRYVAAVAKGALLGVQFHPEKSGVSGLKLLAGALRWSPGSEEHSR